MKVFVSATSADLRECRLAAMVALRKGDLQPKIQEDFPPDERPLLQYLHDLIYDCDVVICLIGWVYGAAPKEESEHPRSYTQWEYEFARRLNKPIFFFVATDDLRPANHPESPELEQRQLAFRRMIETVPEAYNFFRSAEELEKWIAYALERIRLAGGRLPLYYQYMPSPPAYFAGRIEERHQLVRSLRSPTPSTVVVLGIGGQGKTALVHQVLRERHEFPFHAGFWCTPHGNAYSFDQFLDGALNYLSRGKFDKQRFPQIEDRVAELLRILQAQPTLLVLDGAEHWLFDRNSSPAPPASVCDGGQSPTPGFAEFLSRASGLGQGSKVVLTTRVMPDVLTGIAKTIIPVYAAEADQFGLQGLDPDAAVELMRSLGVRGETSEINEFGRRLAFHPLALRVASGYITQQLDGRIEVARVPSNFDPCSALSQLIFDIEPWLPDSKRSQRVLEILAHSLDSLSVDDLTTVIDVEPSEPDAPRAWRSLIRQLARWQLLVWDELANEVTVHPVVKAHFAKRCEAGDSAAIHHRFARQYLQRPISQTAVTLEEMKPRLLAVEHAILAGEGELGWRILQEPVSFHESLIAWCGRMGHFPHGQRMLTQSLAVASADRRPELLMARAALLLPGGLAAEAIQDLDQAWKLVHGEEGVSSRGMSTDARTALSAAIANNRGNAHLQQVRHASAFADFDLAISWYRELASRHDNFSYPLADALMNRGNVWRELGCLERALADYSEALSVYESRLDPVLRLLSTQVAGVLQNRGNAYSDLRQFELALRDYNAAIEIHDCLVRIGRTESESARAGLWLFRGSVYYRQQRLALASADYEQALPVFVEGMRRGQRHFEPLLAYGYLCRAQAVLGGGQGQSANEDIRHARELVDRAIEMESRRDLLGLWVHVRLADALIQFAIGNHESAELAWSSGLQVGGQLLVQEPDVAVVVARYVLAVGQQQFASRPAWVESILSLQFDSLSRLLAAAPPPEALRAEIQAWFTENSLFIATLCHSARLAPQLDKLRKQVNSS